MLSKNDVLERASRSRNSYAARVEESAAHLAGHGIYEAMTEYTLLAHAAMQQRYDLPVDRPFVHIDIGSGSGRMLCELAQQCREASRRCLLIGVEVNDVLARSSVRRLRSEDLPVAEHVYGEESVEQKSRKRPILRRRYPVHEEAVEAMDLTADQQIVIVQDDARKELRALFAVLEKARAQGVGHVDQISWAFPGTSGDLAMQDSPDLHLSHDELLQQESKKLVADVVAGTTRLAYSTLQKGGLLTLFQRLAKGALLESIYQEITGALFPADQRESLQARMFLAQAVVLGAQAQKFNPKMGAVIIPDLHIAEADTTLDYAGMVQNEGVVGSAAARAAERDLFALSLVRSDLHIMGTTASMLRRRPDAQE